MPHEEIEIFSNKYDIKASVKIPNNESSSMGVVLSHGGIINRQSLVRQEYSFGEYLSNELGAYVIAPDFLGETVHNQEIKFSNFIEILNITTKYFAKKYDLDTIMGFGHSIGALVLIHAIKDNRYFDSIVNYGSPFLEFSGRRQIRFVEYLINYISTYDYCIDIRHLLKNIFDKETCIYLENVMLKDKQYNGDNYNFLFDSTMVKDIIESIDTSIEIVINWGKPALFLFGSKDAITKNIKKHYKHQYSENNLRIQHIPNASHVTPCMDTKFQLSKLIPAVSFFRETLGHSELNLNKRSLIIETNKN